MISDENLSSLRVIRTPGIGVKTYYQLLGKYGSATDILTHDTRNYASKKEIEHEIARAQKIGIHYLFLEHENYPHLLKTLDYPPPVIMVKGNVDLLKRPMISIVGARRASLAAQKFCRYLAKDISEQGYSVVSGFARGIDTAAHKGAIDSATIAVMATGCDVIYPKENAKLYDEIAEKGLILAEMPLGQQPMPTLFPRRNRIIAGLSTATVLIEAALSSGSMITAQYALEYNRDVFAVPGFPMDDRVKGCHKLLKDGAHLCEGLDDILNVVESSFTRSSITRGTTHVRKQAQSVRQPSDMTREVIVGLLSHQGTTAEEILQKVELSSNELNEYLTDLELEGKIVRRGQSIVLA